MACRVATHLALAVGLLSLAGTACHSPTEGCDPRGSNNGSAIYATCSAAGVDLQCVSHFTNKYDMYICTQVDENVTEATIWSSSNVTVATFDAQKPGLLKPLSAGIVEISSKYSNYSQTGPIGFFVAPGAAPVQLVWLEVFVQDQATSATIADAEVVVSEDGLPAQQCATDSRGQCFSPPRRFWVLRNGAVRIAVSKDGYEPSDTTTAYPNTNSTPYQAFIKLRRSLGLRPLALGPYLIGISRIGSRIDDGRSLSW